jgi:hypothetical protein
MISASVAIARGSAGGARSGSIVSVHGLGMGDRHKFPGNCPAVLFVRIGRPSKTRGKIAPVPGP